MLTESGKNWIAQHFGKRIDDKYCFVDSGIVYSWYNPDTGEEVSESGGTGRIVSRLVMANMVGKTDVIYVKIGDKKYYYSDLKEGNDGYDVTLDDIKNEILPHDGSPGEDQYCVTLAPKPPKPTPTTGVVCLKTKDPRGNEIHAWIYIDGEFTGRSTPECFELTVASHTVKFVREGFEDLEVTVTPIGGEKIEKEYIMKPVEKEVKPIEIEVVPRKITTEEDIEFLLEPPYSDIPPEVMIGVPTPFRIYTLNHGGYDVRLDIKLVFQHALTKEEYAFPPREDYVDKIIPSGGGASIIFVVTIPETATLGTYYLYIDYTIKEVVKH